MKSIFLTLSVAACFNLSTAEAQSYSLWPKRPPEIEQARRLVRSKDSDKAVEILRPFVTQQGVVGREARKITAAVQVPVYLSRKNPYASVYTVRAGDTLHRIVNTTHCPVEVIMMLNGITDPSALKAGQKLVVTKMDLRVEVYPKMRELCVWDGEELVASYDIVTLTMPPSSQNAKTKVESREGILEGDTLARRSTQYLSSQRLLKLADGNSIGVANNNPPPNIVLNSADVNELALLLSVGAEVLFVNEE